MKKINIKELLRKNKNTRRISLKEVDEPIVSTLPSSNTEIVDSNITIYGSSKDADLTIIKNGELFSLVDSPIATQISSTTAAVQLRGKKNYISFNVDNTKPSKAEINNEEGCLSFGIINDKSDELKEYIKDYGVSYKLKFGEERSDYSFQLSYEYEDSIATIEGNKIVISSNDSESYILSDFYLETSDGHISKAIELELDANKVSIRPNNDFVTNNILDGVTINFTLMSKYQPLITLESYRNGWMAGPVDEKFVFGYKDNQDYAVKAIIKAKDIVSGLIEQKAEDFETTFTLKFVNSQISNTYDGFRVYDREDNNLIKIQSFDETKEEIVVDLTKKIKSAIQNFKIGHEVEDIVLEFKYSNPIASGSDEELKEELPNNYVEIFGIYSASINKRPFIQSKFVSIGVVKQDTPFIEKSLSNLDLCKLNLLEGSIQETISLGRISSKSLAVPLSIMYDSRLLTQKLERPAIKGLPKGMTFNLSQCLIKDRINANKAKGVKEVLYIDGENNTHVLTEKWFYKNDNDEEVVVTKNDVYLSSDQKLKYKDENGTIHDVTYQVDNDEGLTYLSTNSKLNYAKQSDMKMSQSYIISSSDNKDKFEFKIDSNGTIKVPFFRDGGINDCKSYQEVFPDNANDTKVSYKATNVLSLKDVYFVDGLAYKIGEEATDPLDEVNIKCEVLYKNGYYYINDIDVLYEGRFRHNNRLVSVSSVEINDKIIRLEQVDNVSLTDDVDIPDYYVDEDIANVSAQINQCEEYIKELNKQCETYSASIDSLKHQLSIQSDLKAIMNAASSEGDASDELNFKNIDIGDVDNDGVNETEEYKNHIKEQKRLNNLYQQETYKTQIDNINQQITEQTEALKDLYEKVNEYRVQLNNLYSLKEAYINSQKESVQDYIYDKDGNLLGFDYYGKLIYISDRYENEIIISYVDGKMVEVSSAEQKITIHYNKEDFVDYIINSNGHKIAFNWLTSPNRFAVRFLSEEKRIKTFGFVFSDDQKLSSFELANFKKLSFIWTDYKVTSFIEKSRIKRIYDSDVEHGSEKDLATILIEYKSNLTKATNVEKNYIDTYCFDCDRRLISHVHEDKDDQSKGSCSACCYDKDNKLYDLSYKSIDHLMSVESKQFGPSNINHLLIGKGKIDPDKLSNREILALSFDFSDADERYLSNNTVTFNVKIGDYDKTFIFEKIPKGILTIPAFVSNKSGEIQVITTFDNNFGEDVKLDVYRSNASLYEYDEEDQLRIITSQNGAKTISDYSYDRPSRYYTVDKFGVKRITFIQFDADGRQVYIEDGEGNCKETYYDEKGNVIETREYNKANSSLAKVSKTKYDEHGNATEFEGFMRDKNGDYPKETTTYLPGTDLVSSIKYPNGQVMVYGYDFNTGFMTEMASDANGQDNATQYGYVLDYLVSLAHHGVKFSYALDNRGRKTLTKLNGVELVSNVYEDNYSDEIVINGNKVTTTFANGFESITVKDKYGDLISTTTNDGDSIVYEYDDRNRLVKVDKNSSEETVTTTYNIEDQITSNEYKLGNVTTREDITYDSHGRVLTKTETASDSTTTTSFEYVEGKEELVKEVSIGNTKHQFEYDALGRVIRKELLDGERSLVDESIEYLRYGENSLDLVKEHDVRVGGVISDTTEYEYDVSGNITSIKRDEYETRYQYDELGRLIREDNPLLDKTIVYKYDAGGNILLKKEYKFSLEDRLYSPTITSYTYASKGNKDQLINFNGETIAYDVMGRPTSIGTHSLTWNKKGKLVGYDDVVYTYGLNGIRTSKTVDGVKTTYSLINNKILAEQSDDKEIIYRYSSDKLIGFTFNDVEYIYERNIQGDILRIYQNDNLTLVAEYQYDAYGKHKVINHTEDNIGDINPFRYRGYYFDVETGWYYLNARYYSPSMGRFISPDELSILDETRSQINGLNLYMYCGDNPVMKVDPSGNVIFSIFAIVIGAAIGATVSAATNIVSQGIENGWENINWGEVAWSAFIGGVGGAFGATGIGLFGQAFINAGLSAVQSIGTDIINGSPISWNNAFDSAMLGALSGFIGGSGAQSSKSMTSTLFKAMPFKSSNVIKNAISKFFMGGISLKGVQGTMNLLLGNATVSFIKALKSTAIKNVLTGSWKTVLTTVGSEILSPFM